jgi:DNA-directed RNA polymerase subunit alpha
MHIIQEEIGLPSFTVTQVKKGDATHAVFVISPLPPGFGMTLGNALRRVLLSSVPGAAVTALRAQGVQHEYTAMKGVRESIVDISLNIKQLRLKKHSKEPEVVRIEVKGPKQVTAADIKATSDIEVLNPDCVLFHVEKGASVEMQLTVEKGVGYSPAAERNKKQNEPGLVHIDAAFSPVIKVRFDVESARVGQRTDLDKLTIDVTTNGSLGTEEAMQFASQLLQSYFQYFGSDKKVVEPAFMADFSRAAPVQVDDAAHVPVKESYTPIEILNLSPRTLNALINAGVGSIEQLVKCTEATLTNFRGFGAKALDEAKQTLAERGLKLSDDAVES